eukprot:jgi/Botrbrau1/18999/Bobra.0100s0033.1
MSDGLRKKESLKRAKVPARVPIIEICDVCGCKGPPDSLVACRNMESGCLGQRHPHCHPSATYAAENYSFECLQCVYPNLRHLRPQQSPLPRSQSGLGRHGESGDGQGPRRLVQKSSLGQQKRPEKDTQDSPTKGFTSDAGGGPSTSAVPRGVELTRDKGSLHARALVKEGPQQHKASTAATGRSLERLPGSAVVKEDRSDSCPLRGWSFCFLTDAMLVWNPSPPQGAPPQLVTRSQGRGSPETTYSRLIELGAQYRQSPKPGTGLNVMCLPECFSNTAGLEACPLEIRTFLTDPQGFTRFYLGLKVLDVIASLQRVPMDQDLVVHDIIEMFASGITVVTDAETLLHKQELIEKVKITLSLEMGRYLSPVDHDVWELALSSKQSDALRRRDSTLYNRFQTAMLKGSARVLSAVETSNKEDDSDGGIYRTAVKVAFKRWRSCRNVVLTTVIDQQLTLAHQQKSIMPVRPDDVERYLQRLCDAYEKRKQTR